MFISNGEMFRFFFSCLISLARTSEQRSVIMAQTWVTQDPRLCHQAHLVSNHDSTLPNYKSDQATLVKKS